MKILDHCYPCRLFFGRCVGEGRRDLLTRMSIKTRKFIGNTTMDPTLRDGPSINDVTL